MKELVSAWLLILFVIVAMGLAGEMELRDREALDSAEKVLASW